jgi:hypothetical protein
MARPLKLPAASAAEAVATEGAWKEPGKEGKPEKGQPAPGASAEALSSRARLRWKPAVSWMKAAAAGAEPEGLAVCARAA